MRPLPALCLCLCLSGPALAECLPEDRLPERLTYDSGAVVEVLGYKDDAVIYRQTVVESGKTVEMTVHAGLYTLSALRDGEGAVFDWKGTLPAVDDLVAGLKLSSEAMLTTPGLLPPRPFTTEIEVVGLEEITVAGCTLPALKVIVRNREAGKDLGEITKWLHLPTLLSLKSEVREGDRTRAQEVVAME